MQNNVKIFYARYRFLNLILTITHWCSWFSFSTFPYWNLRKLNKLPRLGVATKTRMKVAPKYAFLLHLFYCLQKMILASCYQAYSFSPTTVNMGDLCLWYFYTIAASKMLSSFHNWEKMNYSLQIMQLLIKINLCFWITSQTIITACFCGKPGAT